MTWVTGGAKSIDRTENGVSTGYDSSSLFPLHWQCSAHLQSPEQQDIATTCPEAVTGIARGRDCSASNRMGRKRIMNVQVYDEINRQLLLYSPKFTSTLIILALSACAMKKLSRSSTTLKHGFELKHVNSHGEQ
jgi:hypothetical protein